MMNRLKALIPRDATELALAIIIVIGLCFFVLSFTMDPQEIGNGLCN